MPLPEGMKPFTVEGFTTAVKLRLEEHFPAAWVAGEVSNFTRASSGHVYFTLKDSKASVRCVMWRGFALRLKFEPRNGTEVIVRGGVTVYAPRGDYQLVVEEMEPKGVGAAELALRQLKEKLLRRGYFDPKRKRPLPRYPRRVALVASATGAAVRDMLEILSTRWPLADVVVRPSRVQGDGAGAELAAAVRLLNHFHKLDHLPLCAIVLGRGGGSSEDLAAFNEEVVADAVFESAVPVVSAVGHEVDVSIADLVADYRALTPSQGIAALCPDRGELIGGLNDVAERMRGSLAARLQSARRHVDQLADRPALRKPLERVRELEQTLDAAGERLARAAAAQLERRRLAAAALADQLEGLSPLNVLRRGYSLTRAAGAPGLLRRAADAAVGDRLETRLAEGTVISRVESVEPGGR